MNLGEIVRDVGLELQYAPDLSSHRRDIRAVVNRVYQQLCRARPWPWLTRKRPLYGFPDLVIASQFGFPAGSTVPRFIQIAEAQLRGKMYPADDAGAFNDIQIHLNNALFELNDAAKRDLGDGNWEEAPFIIERVIPAGSGDVKFYLDPRANIVSFTGNEGAIRVSFPRTQLPVDCDSMIALTDDDGYPLKPLPPQLERKRILDRQTAGTPGYVLEDGGAEVRFPEFVHPGISAGVSPVNPNQTVDIYARENARIRTAIIGTAVNQAPNGLTAGTKYRAFVSWWYGNRFGPPSNTVEATMTATNKTLRLTNLPVLPSLDFGRVLGVFVAEGEGAFYLSSFQLVPTDSDFDVTAMPTGQEALKPTRWDEVFPGQYQYIRIYPRPTVMTRFELTYRARPRELIEDVDTPEFAEPFHHLLTWLAAADFSARSGGDFHRRCTANAERVRRQLTARYFPQDRYAQLQKGQIGQPTLSFPFFTADIDYEG